jgi:hypothetical protein
MSNYTEAQINERTNQIIAKNAAEHKVDPSSFTPSQREDARNFAREQLTLETNPHYMALQTSREENRQLQAQLDALRSRGPQSAPAGKAHFVAEQVRGRIGNATWFTLSNDAKIRAAGEDPANVSIPELKKLFGRGCDTAKALDYSKQNPSDYARKRELARLLDVYGG